MANIPPIIPLMLPIVTCAGLDLKIFPILPSPKKKYRAIRINITPKHCFKVELLIERMYSVAKKENSTLKKTTQPIIRQRMYFQFLTAIIKAVLPANKPESITDSPYEGKKKGKNIITKMPNPNPLTRWIKLATMVKRKTNNKTISIIKLIHG